MDLHKTDVTRLKLPGVSWSCGSCRGVGAASGRRSLIVPSDDTGAVSSDSFAVLREIQGEMKSLARKYEMLIESITFCSDSITAFERSISSMNKKMNEMEKITKENLELRTSVKILQDRVDSLEQQSRMNNVEICGIPEKENENLFSVVSRVGESIGCNVMASEVDTFYRVPTFDSSKPKPIIIRFLSKQKRDSFLGASRVKRRQSEGKIQVDNISRDLFINEHLTSSNKKLFKKTRDTARSKNYKFTWTRNGSIFVRKDERSKIIKISGEADLAKIA